MEINYEAEASDPTEESSEETAYFLADFRPIINFDYKTSELTSEAYEELDSIATILERSDKCEIVLRGYTDDVGPKGYNSRLSESRANIVRSYLVGKGISPERITRKILLGRIQRMKGAPQIVGLRSSLFRTATIKLYFLEAGE